MKVLETTRRVSNMNHSVSPQADKHSTIIEIAEQILDMSESFPDDAFGKWTCDEILEFDHVLRTFELAITQQPISEEDRRKLVDERRFKLEIWTWEDVQAGINKLANARRRNRMPQTMTVLRPWFTQVWAMLMSADMGDWLVITAIMSDKHNKYAHQ